MLFRLFHSRSEYKKKFKCKIYRTKNIVEHACTMLNHLNLSYETSASIFLSYKLFKNYY